jgi:hypothetical protein
MSSRTETAYPLPTLVAVLRCRRALLGGTRWVAPCRPPGPARLHHERPVRRNCVRLHAHSEGRDRGSGDIRVPPSLGSGVADHGRHRHGERLASPVTLADSKSLGAALLHPPASNRLRDGSRLPEAYRNRFLTVTATGWLTGTDTRGSLPMHVMHSPGEHPQSLVSAYRRVSATSCSPYSPEGRGCRWVERLP